MSWEELPSHFDVVVIGTGLPESILAAACSRVGLNVLHTDRNNCYGGPWASFNLEGFKDWVKEHDCASTERHSLSDVEAHLNEKEEALPLYVQPSNVDNVKLEWHIQVESALKLVENTDLTIESSCENEDSTQTTTVCSSVPDELHEEEQAETEKTEVSDSKDDESEDLSRYCQDAVNHEWRRFSLDLAPKILLSRGPMVEVLISSNVGRYAEFKSVNRILTCIDDTLKEVPCSRSEVFQSKDVSILEKRMLMKFLTFSLNYDKEPGVPDSCANKTFVEFLTEQALTPSLRHYVQHALAMSSSKDTAVQGLEKVRTFLMSTGRYGNSPFLFPLYGCGELPQCFCRLCAVFGGTYYLGRPIEALVMDESKRCTAVISGHQRITFDNLVIEKSYLAQPKDTTTKCIARGILLTNKSILKSAKESVSIFNFETGDCRTITLIELGPSSLTCPKGFFLVYVSTGSALVEDVRSCFDEFLLKFFQYYSPEYPAEQVQVEKPLILWSCFYNQIMDSTNSFDEPFERENVVVTNSPDDSLDYRSMMTEVQSEFSRLWPNEEFLPAAPDPEDISNLNEEENVEVTTLNSEISNTNYTPSIIEGASSNEAQLAQSEVEISTDIS